MKGCESRFKSFKQFMEGISKYVKRVVIDIQYYLNSQIVGVMGDGQKGDEKGEKSKRASGKDLNSDLVNMT